jgi:hypothetical protein
LDVHWFSERVCFSRAYLAHAHTCRLNQRNHSGAHKTVAHWWAIDHCVSTQHAKQCIVHTYEQNPSASNGLQGRVLYRGSDAISFTRFSSNLDCDAFVGASTLLSRCSPLTSRVGGSAAAGAAAAALRAVRGLGNSAVDLALPRAARAAIASTSSASDCSARSLRCECRSGRGGCQTFASFGIIVVLHSESAAGKKRHK